MNLAEQTSSTPASSLSYTQAVALSKTTKLPGWTFIGTFNDSYGGNSFDVWTIVSQLYGTVYLRFVTA